VTTDDSPVVGIVHAPRCQRTRPPVLIAAWHRTDAPLFQCPSCGATAPAPDTRPTRPHTEESPA